MALRVINKWLRHTNTYKTILISSFIFLFSSWIFITPPGSGIDDDFHLPSIWCGQGDKDETCSLGKADDLLGLVPEYVANAPFCLGYEPFESGACTQNNLTSKTFAGARINELGLLRPNGYYFINSFFIVEDFNNSIWLMRALNLFLFSILIILAVYTSNLRNKLLLGWLLIANFNPLFFSVLGSNNNSSWFFASVIFFFFFLYTLFYSKERRDLVISLVGISTIFLLSLNSRTDTLPILIIMLILFSLLVVKSKWLLGYVAFLTAGVIFVIFRGQLPGIGGLGLTSGFGSIDPRRDAVEVFTHNIVRLPSFFNGLVGGWGINWLDFRIPGIFTFALQISVVFLIYLTYKNFNRSFAIGLLGILGTFGIYFWFLQIDLNYVGEMVQPRYLYPIFAFSLGFFIFSSNNLLNLASSKYFVLAVLVAVGNSGALYFTIRRYVTGMDVRYWNLNELVEWWPLLPSPMVFWIIWTLILFFTMLIYADFSKKVLSKVT